MLPTIWFPGDLLFIVDIMTGWQEEEITKLVARILQDRHLCRSGEVTVLLIVPYTPSKASGDTTDERLEMLSWLEESVYEEARKLNYGGAGRSKKEQEREREE